MELTVGLLLIGNGLVTPDKSEYPFVWVEPTKDEPLLLLTIIGLLSE